MCSVSPGASQSNKGCSCTLAEHCSFDTTLWIYMELLKTKAIKRKLVMSSTDWEGSHSLDTAVSVAAVRPVVSSVKYPRWTTEDESCQLSPEQSNVNNVLWLLIGLGRTILPWRAIGLIFGRQQISVEVGHISKLIRDPSLRTVVSPPQPPPALPGHLEHISFSLLNQTVRTLL